MAADVEQLDQPFHGFRPLRPAPRGKRVATVLISPFLWLIGIAVLGAVVEGSNVVGIGLAAASLSLVVGALMLLIARRRRIRREA